MNATYRRVKTRFGPQTRFEVKPVPAVPFRGEQETQFERLKDELVRHRITTELNAERGHYVRRAANEAAALAWTTPYPLLVFPTLFEEKADAARVHALHQRQVLKRSRNLLAA